MSRLRLCVATRNAHKLLEIRAALADLDIEISAAADHPQAPDVEEDAATLEGNAEKKARWVAAATGLPALADDTGLEVEALGGAPGVYSARYAGPGCNYADNNAKLLSELAAVGAAERGARFRCVIAIAIPNPAAAARDFAARVRACDVSLHVGELKGRILRAPRGDHGFGYDPVFWVDEAGASLAELDTSAKNRISHRGRALAAARTALRARLASG
jgi:XTP/dITP diphosphohydrolase